MYPVSLRFQCTQVFNLTGSTVISSYFYLFSFLVGILEIYTYLFDKRCLFFLTCLVDFQDHQERMAGTARQVWMVKTAEMDG